MRIKVAVLLLALLGGCDNPAPDQKGFAGLGNQAAAFKPVVPGRVFSFRRITAPTTVFASNGGMSPPTSRTIRATSSARNGHCFAVR